ncbi:MAG: lytic murein transglycosylase [Pseudomonadota bacterium]
MRNFAALLATALVAFSLSTPPASASAGFRKWVKEFEGVAARNGIKRSTYRKAFDGITSADPEVLELARYQPEFKQKLWMYFDSRINEASISKGQEMLKKHSRTLAAVEKRYGVSRYIILAIWSMESGYGAALEKPKALRSVIRSLATLAYADKRRRKFGRTQLISAMKILQSGRITTNELRGSWAGAMGHTQFIPTSYAAWAQDFDGDGRKDIWRSIPDALATAANLLKKNGWVPGRTWGYEVRVPNSVAKRAGQTRTTSQWAALGVKRVSGRPFPANVRAVLKFPAGRSGPAFLMTKNFFTIKRYNNSDKYALAVGHLADQIAGYGDFAQPVPRPFKKLTSQEAFELQHYLAKMGVYTGEIDGKIGSGTRASIRKAQIKLGLKVDGFESPKLLEALRRAS